LIQMVFATPEQRAQGDKLVHTEEVPTEMRNRYSLTDDEVQQLAAYAMVIEAHYGRAMDIEWGKDGVDGQLYILQARPETVKSQQKDQVEHRFKLKATGTVLAQGRAIGQKKLVRVRCAWSTTSTKWTWCKRGMCWSPI